MTPHPLTLKLLRSVAARPGMFIRDFSLCELEIALWGFEAGLTAAGAMGSFENFNQSFSDFLPSVARLSCTQGWAIAMHEKYGQGRSSFEHFLSLVDQATSESVSVKSRRRIRTVRHRSIRVTGDQRGGWSVAGPDALSAPETLFDFGVVSDGNGNFLLVYASADEKYSGNTWHETIGDAETHAHANFGIEPSEWQGGEP